MNGSAGLFAVNLIAASLYESTINDPTKAASVALAAVTMFLIFDSIYAATWGTVVFLIPTEIFPSERRARGSGFSITGWAIGVGWTVLVSPIMFGSIRSRTYFLFVDLSLLWIPIVYLFYPETKDRSLASIEALFSSKSHSSQPWRRVAGRMETFWLLGVERRRWK
jgi:Sugar (and other) transporter